MSQLDLAISLQLMVDRLSHDEPCSRARCRAAGADLQILADDNPRSFWSDKVLHRLGRKRVARLLAWVEPRDLDIRASVRDYANSSRATRRRRQVAEERTDPDG